MVGEAPQRHAGPVAEWRHTEPGPVVGDEAHALVVQQAFAEALSGNGTPTADEIVWAFW